jgi:hypothetical protein
VLTILGGDLGGVVARSRVNQSAHRNDDVIVSDAARLICAGRLDSVSLECQIVLTARSRATEANPALCKNARNGEIVSPGGRDLNLNSHLLQQGPFDGNVSGNVSGTQ